MRQAVFLDRDGVINRAVVKNGKPFEVWNGTVMTNKKGQIAFPYSDIGTIAENEN